MKNIIDSRGLLTEEGRRILSPFRQAVMDIFFSGEMDNATDLQIKTVEQVMKSIIVDTSADRRGVDSEASPISITTVGSEDRLDALLGDLAKKQVILPDVELTSEDLASFSRSYHEEDPDPLFDEHEMNRVSYLISSLLSNPTVAEDRFNKLLADKSADFYFHHAIKIFKDNWQKYCGSSFGGRYWNLIKISDIMIQAGWMPKQIGIELRHQTDLMFNVTVQRMKAVY